MSTRWSRVHNPRTPTDRLVMVVVSQVAWMLAAGLTLFYFQLYTLENYFILSFIGLLSVLHVYAPTGEPPAWWSLARLVTLVGYVIFIWIMYRRVTEVAVLF